MEKVEVKFKWTPHKVCNMSEFMGLNLRQRLDLGKTTKSWGIFLGKVFPKCFFKRFLQCHCAPTLGDAYKIPSPPSPNITHLETVAAMVAPSTYAFLAAVAIAIVAVARAGTVRLSPESELGEPYCVNLYLMHSPPSGRFAGFVDNFPKVPLASLGSREAA